ncbi:DUF7196 family protein [Streptomyces sp. CB03578]|uniref:DUF7196 family protein n=1 Tax=Streptomyces sp. CB03578 TaxID=1718987 RepID=UPI000ABF775A|nr:hypothetical protein [Streptomyces sp. CB03578]
MACNCGGATRPTVIIYQLNLPDGSVRQYHTWQEADSANQRVGGLGTILVINQ